MLTFLVWVFLLVGVFSSLKVVYKFSRKSPFFKFLTDK